ncbi:hypothetical protein C725_1368 [Pacificimonas flava]|uniref:Uncharacterized protein n=1 Tax=Pacificimonas flava TaxID=1234595 RepID=M2U618_9SPHN|nr:hypothetical protein C725_1368 [Pacificimonas flava]
MREREECRLLANQIAKAETERPVPALVSPFCAASRAMSPKRCAFRRLA